ncbi:MAG: hypothetical protein A4S09_16185 [Proteobacteria bacterium SG_bin7]|nr:MAG: hypothetical protein A4S09_16185 [Proteobacteria bacterium SG_bin7]
MKKLFVLFATVALSVSVSAKTPQSCLKEKIDFSEGDNIEITCDGDASRPSIELWIKMTDGGVFINSSNTPKTINLNASYSDNDKRVKLATPDGVYAVSLDERRCKPFEFISQKTGCLAECRGLILKIGPNKYTYRTCNAHE